MARIEGVDPKQTSFLMRYVFTKVRKMLGRDLTPQKIAARVPRVFWAGVLGEWLLGQKSGGAAETTDACHPSHSGAGRLSVLNRRKFCWRQNEWIKR